MVDFIVRFYHTWNAIKHVRLGLVPQSERPTYLDAYSREYVRVSETINWTDASK